MSVNATLGTSYAPIEPEATLLVEKSILRGITLGIMAYGIHLAVFGICAKNMLGKLITNLRAKSSPRELKQRRFIAFSLAFSCIMFLSGTMNIVGNAQLVALMFIDNRNAPGGPVGWLSTFYFNTSSVIGNVGFVIGNVFADGLLLWRTATIWDNWYIVVLPCFMYLGSISMAIVGVFQTSRPLADLWTKTTVSFFLPFFSLSVSLNIILTLLIVGRLQYMSQLIKKSLGRQYGRLYTSLSSIMVESAAIYTVASIIFIGTYAADVNAQHDALAVLAQVMCISPELIILRVSRGQAWERSTMASITDGSIVFAEESGQGTSVSQRQFPQGAGSRAGRSTTLIGQKTLDPSQRSEASSSKEVV